MNFFAHLHVVRRAGWVSPEQALGAMLPDLLSLARIRADHRLLPADVRTGRSLHHQADVAFHGHVLFRTLVTELRSLLEQAGLPPGPARAGAHLGNELLLDGMLPDPDSVRIAFRAALHEAPAVAWSLAPHDRPTWQRLTERLCEADPDDFVDPLDVAGRIHRAVGRRPRLSFGPELVTPLAEALVVHRSTLERSGPTLIDDVGARLPKAG